MSPAPGKPFVPVLHGLRGLAALAVLLYHWEGSFPGLSDALKQAPFAGTTWDLLWPVRLGWTGVNWFFVLSGFLLAGNLWHTPMTVPVVVQFWQRRLLRIYPGVWLQLGVLLLFLQAAGLLRNFSPGQAIGNALLWLSPLQGGVPPYNGVYWTLPLELSFYLALPLLLVLLRRTGLAAFLAVALAVSLTWRLGIAWLHHAGSAHAISLMFIRNVLPGMLFVFAIGMAINPLRHRLQLRGRSGWLLALFAIQLGLMYASTAYQGVALQDDAFLLVYDLVLAVVIAATIALLLDPPAWMAWLSSRPLVWLGEVSYGVYLWHFPVQRLLPRLWPDSWLGTPEGSLAALFISLGLTLPLAAASYRWIEQPALRRFRWRASAQPA